MHPSNPKTFNIVATNAAVTSNVWTCMSVIFVQWMQIIISQADLQFSVLAPGHVHNKLPALLSLLACISVVFCPFFVFLSRLFVAVSAATCSTQRDRQDANFLVVGRFGRRRRAGWWSQGVKRVGRLLSGTPRNENFDSGAGFLKQVARRSEA